MKHILALLLSACLLLSLCACGAAASDAAATTEASEDAALLVGYARVDITPTENIAMAIYGSESERISTGYMDKLYG